MNENIIIVLAKDKEGNILHEFRVDSIAEGNKVSNTKNAGSFLTLVILSENMNWEDNVEICEKLVNLDSLEIYKDNKNDPITIYKQYKTIYEAERSIGATHDHIILRFKRG